jgi:deoxyribodipyrimidine photo-lyase
MVSGVMSKPLLIIYWIRRDLRLADNPALVAASVASRHLGASFLPLFIIEDYMVEAKPEYQFGYPSRFFLSHALPKFLNNFKTAALVRGKGAGYLIGLSKQFDLKVFVNDDIYIDFYTQIKKIRLAGVDITVTEDALSIDKETRSGEGRLYSVFSPFKKNVWSKFMALKTGTNFSEAGLKYADSAVINSLPNRIDSNTDIILSVFDNNRLLKINTEIINLDDLTLRPELKWWYESEAEAVVWFKNYLEIGALDAYAAQRDSLELDAEGDGATSKMSLALSWGLVSARILKQMIQEYFGESFDNPFSSRVSAGALSYLSELIWREFYRYQLFHYPELLETEFQNRFRGKIKWVDDVVALERFMAWVKGETGYSVVDAAMKQIATTGWMHNRSRMIVASILTKNLGVDWRWGQEYFRAALLDLDEASNNGGWQWAASVGSDPKPIRIFNPDLQAKNYDASGAYRLKWLGDQTLRAPVYPIVEHRIAREEALSRYGLSKEVPRDY